MKTIKIGSHTILVGLDWMASQASTTKEAIEEALLQEPNKKYGLVLEGTDSFSIGMTDSSEKAIVGAAWLADSQKNDGDFVLIEKIEENEYWLCAIKNGIPFYGSDILGNLSSIEEEAKTFLQSGGFRLITMDEHLSSMLSPYATSYSASGFEQSIKGKGNFKVKSLKLDKKIMIVSSVIFGTLMAGFLGFSYYDDMSQKELAEINANALKIKQDAEQLKNSQALKDEFNANKERLTKEALNKIQEEYNKKSNSISAIYSNFFNGLSLNMNGWKYKTGLCELSDCTITLQPKDGASNKGLIALIPKAQIVENGAILTEHVEVPLNPVSISQLKTKDAFLIEELSILQEVKGLFTISTKPLEEIFVEVPVPQGGMANADATVAQPSVAQKTVEKVSIGYMKGTFRIEGKSLWALKDVGERIVGDSFIIQKVSVGFDNFSINNWGIDGVYYTKTNPKIN